MSTGLLTTWWPRFSSLPEDLFGHARTTMEMCSQIFWLKVSALKHGVSRTENRQGYLHLSYTFCCCIPNFSFALWRHFCVALRFRITRTHDISAGVSRRQNYRSRSCSRYRDKTLPWTPEGKRHQCRLIHWILREYSPWRTCPRKSCLDFLSTITSMTGHEMVNSVVLNAIQPNGMLKSTVQD